VIPKEAAIRPGRCGTIAREVGISVSLGFHAEGFPEGIVVFFWLKPGKNRRACHRRGSAIRAMLAFVRWRQHQK
jgi:hypothetical protein